MRCSDYLGLGGSAMQELLVGVLVSFNSTAWTAVIDVRGGVPFQRLEGVPVNRGLASAALTAGRYVCIWLPAASGAEAVLIAVWT